MCTCKHSTGRFLKSRKRATVNFLLKWPSRERENAFHEATAATARSGERVLDVLKAMNIFTSCSFRLSDAYLSAKCISIEEARRSTPREVS